MGHLTNRSVLWTRAGLTLAHKKTSKNLIAERRRSSRHHLNLAAEVVQKHAHDAEAFAGSVMTHGKEARCLVWRPVRTMIRHLGFQSSPQGYAVMFTYDGTDDHVRRHVRQLAKTIAPKVTGLVHATALRNPTAFEKTVPAPMDATTVHYFDFGHILVDGLMVDVAERLGKVKLSEDIPSPHAGSIRPDEQQFLPCLRSRVRARSL